VKFSALDKETDLFVTPVRHANIAEGTYATCSYAVMANDTSHLLMINPSPRPVRIAKGETVGMFEPFHPNTPFCFYGATTSALSAPSLPTATAQILHVTDETTREPSLIGTTNHAETKQTQWTESERKEGPLCQGQYRATLGLRPGSGRA
jgi:hypothetical protein